MGHFSNTFVQNICVMVASNKLLNSNPDSVTIVKMFLILLYSASLHACPLQSNESSQAWLSWSVPMQSNGQNPQRSPEAFDLPSAQKKAGTSVDTTTMAQEIENHAQCGPHTSVFLVPALTNVALVTSSSR